MKHLPQVLFWVGIVLIPLSWLMWYFGPEIEIGRQVISNIDDFQPHQVNKKKAVYARHEGMRKKYIPTISTNGLRIKELYDLNSKEFNLKEEEGVSSRVKKI